MNGVASLYGDTDMARVMYGEHARHVPCWMYAQHQGSEHGKDIVGLVGASLAPGDIHPLRYGTEWSHHFIIGEIIVRPQVVIGTNALRGEGAGSLFTGDHDISRMLSDGVIVAGSDARVRQIIERSNRAPWRD
jgi:hypothetical protein